MVIMASANERELLPKLEMNRQEIELDDDEDDDLIMSDEDEDNMEMGYHSDSHQLDQLNEHEQDLNDPLNSLNNKLRKPYTVSKPRETWTNEEHAKFIEALSLYERDWKRIGAHIGSKTIIQIRSHAQKYFIKMQKMGLDNYIPPPRPKKRARRYDQMEHDNMIHMNQPMAPLYNATMERNKDVANAAKRLATNVHYAREVNHQPMQSNNQSINPHAMNPSRAQPGTIYTTATPVMNPHPSQATATPVFNPTNMHMQHQNGQMMPARISASHAGTPSNSSQAFPHMSAQHAPMMMHASHPMPTMQPMMQQPGMPGHPHGYPAPYQHMTHVPQMMTGYMHHPMMYSHPAQMHQVNHMNYSVPLQQPMMHNSAPLSMATTVAHPANPALHHNQPGAAMMYQAVPQMPQMMAPYMAAPATSYQQVMYTAPPTPDILSPTQQTIHHRDSLMSPSLLHSSSTTPALIHSNPPSNSMAPPATLPHRYSPSTGTQHIPTLPHQQSPSPSGPPSMRASPSGSSPVVHIRPTPTRPSPIITTMNDSPHASSKTNNDNNKSEKSELLDSDNGSDDAHKAVAHRRSLAVPSIRRDSMQVMKDVSLTLVTMRDGFSGLNGSEDEAEGCDNPHSDESSRPHRSQLSKSKLASSSRQAPRKARRHRSRSPSRSRSRSRSRSPPPAKSKSRNNNNVVRKSSSRSAAIPVSRKSESRNTDREADRGSSSRRQESKRDTPRSRSNMTKASSPDLSRQPNPQTDLAPFSSDPKPLF